MSIRSFVSTATLFALSLVAALTAPGQTLSSAPALASVHAQTRITAAIDNNALTTLEGRTAIAAHATRDLGAVADQQPLGNLMLLLSPTDAQKSALTDYLADLQNPASPSYHKFLSPAEYAEHFGVADEDIQSIRGWLTSFGFRVESVSAGRTVITFSGTHGQLRQAFHTELHRFQSASGEVVANNVDPSIPTALAGVVRGIVGLNNLQKTAQHITRGAFHFDGQTDLATPAPLENKAGAAVAALNGVQPAYTTTEGYRAFTPTDFATVYNLKAVWNAGIDGTGQKIAIAGRSRVNPSDVTYFRSLFGITSTLNFTTVVAGDIDPGLAADEGEQALDVEWSSSIARNAAITLVVAASTYTADGLDISINYAVNNNTAPILNVSYGACELALGNDGNAFYSSMWEQAAAQGITVLVSSGDAGAATCDDGDQLATSGNQVNGLASSPNVTSLGGTDFYGNYFAPNTYFSKTNDALNGSALSYVPESVWDDSCANPIIWMALNNAGYVTSSPEAACNTQSVIQNTGTLIVAGGGGGISKYYPLPPFQASVPGTRSSTMRNVPDVSLFSADGILGAFLVFCQSDALTTGTCTFGPALANLQAAGGTSFAAPQFAAIVALISQKMGSIQGNINPILYSMGTTQYTGSVSCSSSSGIPPSSCIFHDIDKGSNSVPCYKSGTDCAPAIAGDSYGVIGYNSGTGYDQATGLGSVDVANLINNWASTSSAFQSTTTSLQLAATSAVYGAGIGTTVTVSSSGSTIPAGDVTILSDSGVAYYAEIEVDPLANGQARPSLTQLPAGSYTISANYSGDSTHTRSNSSKVAVIISKATPSVQLSLSRTTLTASQNSTLLVTVAGAAAGAGPSGTVTVTDGTRGNVIGTVALTTSNSANSTASLLISPQSLAGGANNLVVAYSGDANYNASTGNAAISYTAPLTMTATANALTINTMTAESASTTVTVAGANGAALAYPIALTCTGALPSGAACSLSSTVLTAAAPSSTVTVQYTPVNSGKPSANSRVGTVFVAGLFGLLAVGAGTLRRRGAKLSATLSLALPLSLAAAVSLSLTACSSSTTNITNNGTSLGASTVTLAASSLSPAVGSTLTLSGQVTGSKGTPTGSVTFDDAFNGATYSLNAVALSSGALSWQTSGLNLGTHTITALYAGDTVNQAAVSAPVVVDVNSVTTLNVTAIDANGNAAVLPLTTTIQ